MKFYKVINYAFSLAKVANKRKEMIRKLIDFCKSKIRLFCIFERSLVILCYRFMVTLYYRSY